MKSNFLKRKKKATAPARELEDSQQNFVKKLLSNLDVLHAHKLKSIPGERQHELELHILAGTS